MAHPQEYYEPVSPYVQLWFANVEHIADLLPDTTNANHSRKNADSKWKVHRVSDDFR